MRPLQRHLLTALLVLLAALVAAGCGGDDDSSGSAARDASATSDTEQAETAAEDGGQADAELEVVLKGVGDKGGLGPEAPAGMRCTKSIPATCTATVECPAAQDDDSPFATSAEVCAWLRTTGLELLTEEVPENEACTMIYGGPATASVTGTVDGTEIDASFSREQGCAIARWDAVSPLWTGELPGEQPAGEETPPAPNATPPDTPTSSTPPEAIDDPPEAFQG